MYSHSDFGKSFKLVITEEPVKEIKDKFFNDLSSIDKKLIDYIIKIIDRSYGKIVYFIYKIDEVSLKKKRSINLSTIKEVLGE